MLSRIPLLVWFLIPTVIIIGVGIWFFSTNPLTKPVDESKPAPVSKPVEGTVDYQIVSREHIAQGTSGSGYNSNPPSSGPHWTSPAAKGIYDDAHADQEFIHNLEHG